MLLARPVSSPALRGCFVALLLLAAPAFDGGARAQRPRRPRASFEEGVATVLRARCTRCHGAEKASGGLRLDSYDALMRGGERGPAIMAGNPGKSLLVQKILRRDRPPMPPRAVLPASEISIIRFWIQAGAEP